uniref:WD repeat domain 33 n=1 Tax=Anolis carolinensis TaxID=28377 RepID=A0A803TCU9_ANOCA
MATEIGSPPQFFHMPRFQHQSSRQLFYKRPDFAQQQAMQQLTFDRKCMRKAVNRKTIDYNPSVIKYLENRVWQRDQLDMRAIQPDAGYYNDLVPPIGMLNNPMNAVKTKFVRTSTNKVKCPVFVVSGEFTLWNGLTFNFETTLQAHASPVRAMTWSRNDMWMLTADHGGYVKYWQSNMNNVKMFQAHKEAIREDNVFVNTNEAIHNKVLERRAVLSSLLKALEILLLFLIYSLEREPLSQNVSRINKNYVSAAGGRQHMSAAVLLVWCENQTAVI